jgi:hypothetical protein
MRLGDLSPAELQTLLTLPEAPVSSIAANAGFIPISSSSWMTPSQLVHALQFPASTPTGGGLAAWLAANSTAVYVVAAAAFLLAMFGGKRRG